MIKLVARHTVAAAIAASIGAGSTQLSLDGYLSLAQSEGLVLTPYYDTAGVLTVCYGETQNIELREYTVEECTDMLVRRVEGDFVPAILNCTRADVWYSLRKNTKDAVIEFSYNVGTGAYCRGSVSKRLNAGRREAACDRMELYNKIRVNGKLVPSKGLTNRRTYEANLCRRGFA